MNCEALLEAALRKSLSLSTRGNDASKVLLDGFHPKPPKKTTTGSLERMGIDRDSLEELGLDKTAQDRIYKILHVYSEGFFSFIKDLNEEARKRLWFTFLRLTETSFNAICAVDSTLRQEYERSLRTLLSEHNKLIQQSRAEFDNVQEQMQEQMSREAASRHKAQLDSALTQSRQMQLEEYTTQIVEELRQERDLNQRLAEEILSQRESLAQYSSRIQVLVGKNEGLNKVSEELESVTEAWRRVSAEKQVAEYEKSRVQGERERMKATLVEGLTKTETLLRENEENKTKLANLMSILGETTNKLLLAESKYVSTIDGLDRLQSNYLKTHSLLFLADKLCASAFQQYQDDGGTPALVECYGRLIFSKSISENEDWGDELLAAAEAIDRKTFSEMSRQVKLKLSETEAQLKNAQTELLSASCKLAASQFVAQRVWLEEVEKQHVHIDKIQQRSSTGATELLSVTEKVALLEGELATLQTAKAERDDGFKRLTAAASREQIMAIELEKMSINLRHKTAESSAQCEQLQSLGSLLSLQENEINQLKSDAASLREVAKRSVAEAERKSKHLGILNLSMENISNVFKLLLRELVRVGDVVEKEIKSIEVGSIPGKGGSRTQRGGGGGGSSSSFQQCRSGIEGDESLLQKEKSVIQEVMSKVVGLEAEISRVLALARERNDFADRHRSSERELSKIKAWARAERQRLVADSERKTLQVEERVSQTGLLVDQLQKERKEQSAAIHDLRNELMRVNNTHEVLVDKLHQLCIPEIEAILTAGGFELVQTNQAEADEEIKVSWDFDDVVSCAKVVGGSNQQSSFVSFEEFSATKAAPPSGQKSGKSPLEQLRL